MAHWSDAYYGGLYQATVEDLLTPRLSALEAETISRLLRLGPADRVLDLACGRGRHAWPLAGRVGLLVGLERSAACLGRAATGSTPAAAPTSVPAMRPRFLRADLRALPLRPSTFDAAFSWYASLFMYDDATNEALLGAVARLLRPGGRLLVQHANPLSLALRPVERAQRTLEDGSTVEEVSAFDPASGVDRCRRRLVRPDGGALEGTAELRYYRPTEWESLAGRVGLRLVEITSTAPPASGAPGPGAPDLVALLETP